MSNQVNANTEWFNGRIREVEALLSITRASELQEQAILALEQLDADVKKEKQLAMAAVDEDAANLLLGCECVVDALIAELRMWLFLKHERPDEAWDQLVRAQMSSISAVRAHARFSHLEQHHRRLELLERLVFPPQIFLSSGMIVRSQLCSICGQEYGDCDHIAGNPYLGQFCSIVAKEIELDHVAIVTSPADKRCRVREFSAENGTRNRMTWLLKPDPEVPKQGDGLLNAESASLDPIA